MAINPNIALGVQPVKFGNTAFEGLRDVMAMQQSRQQQQLNQIKIQEAQREQAEANAFQQIIAQTGDDWEAADKLLAQHAPGLRQGYLKAVHDARRSRFLAAQEQSAADLAEANVGMRSLGLAIEQPEMADVILPGLATKFPDLAPMIQQIQQLPATDPRRVEAIKALRMNGLSAKEQIEREDKWNQAFLKGDFRFAGEAMQHATNPEQTAKVLHDAGLTWDQVRAIQANPEAWSMTAEERSQEVDRTGRRVETQRANLADEAEATRYHDMSDTTARRGQNMVDARTRAGQALTEPVETVMVNGKPTIVRRSQAIGQAPGDATGGAGGAKLSATAIEKIAGADTALGSLQTIESALPVYESKLGPIAGRMASGSLMLPSADQGLAEFAAEIATLKNSVVKATTGAAMSEPEAKRIMSQVPDLTNQPAVFRARLAATRRNLETLKRRTIELSGGSVAAETTATLPDMSGLRQGMGRTFREGPYAGQTWTLGPDGQPKRVR